MNRNIVCNLIFYLQTFCFVCNCCLEFNSNRSIVKPTKEKLDVCVILCVLIYMENYI